MTAERLDVSAPARSRLPDADYGDAFGITSDGYRSPESWARRALESGSPLTRRLFALTVWQTALGLRLGPSDSPDHVAGWAIVENDPAIVVLRAESWLITAVMVFESSESNTTWSTLLRYEAKPARGVWAVIGIGHRRIAPGVLTGAGRSLARRPGEAGLRT